MSTSTHPPTPFTTPSAASSSITDAFMRAWLLSLTMMVSHCIKMVLACSLLHVRVSSHAVSSYSFASAPVGQRAKLPISVTITAC